MRNTKTKIIHLIGSEKQIFYYFKRKIIAEFIFKIKNKNNDTILQQFFLKLKIREKARSSSNFLKMKIYRKNYLINFSENNKFEREIPLSQFFYKLFFIKFIEKTPSDEIFC